MADRGTVVWAPDPFRAAGNPRPWLVLAADRLPYPDEESIAVGLTTQSHHPGSFPVSSEAWLRGEPVQQSYVLPWTVATLKHELHIVGVQGNLTAEFVDQVATDTASYLNQ